MGAVNPLHLTGLRTHMASGKLVHVTRGHGETTEGYVLGVGSSAVFMRVFDDFIDEGHLVFPAKHIKAIRCGKYEKATERILKGEGLWPKTESHPRINLRSLPEALKSIQRLKTVVWVEVVEPESTEIAGFIGYIRRVTPTRLTLHNYDTTYRWDAGPTYLPLEEIVAVSWNTHYIRVTEKYVRTRKE